VQVHTEAAYYYGLRWTYSYAADAVRLRDVIQDPGPRQVAFGFTKEDVVLRAGAPVDTRWRLRASRGGDGASLVQDIRVLGHQAVTIGGSRFDAVVLTQRQTMRTSYGRATATVTGWIDGSTGLVLRQEGTFGTWPSKRHVLRQLISATPDAALTEPASEATVSRAAAGTVT
jgi:hypothetical protein